MTLSDALRADYIFVIYREARTNEIVCIRVLGKVASACGGRVPIGDESEFLQRPENTSTSCVDLAMMGRFIVRVFNHEQREGTSMVNFQVNDMTCGHCAGTIRAAIITAAPQADIEVDLSARRVAVEDVTDIDAVERAIREAGYTPERQP